jgi:DNA-directed RNA polymerase specialized sigma24 family protein
LTLHKVRQLAEFHTAGKRSVNRERGPEAAEWLGLSLEVLARDPSPADAAALADELELVMSRLEPAQQKMLELRLQGHSLEEIASACDCSSRTVKRVLCLIREEMEQLRGSL